MVRQSFLRMLYSASVTALETYLSDSFVKKVTGNEELIKKLMLTTPEFQDRKYSLSELIDWQETANEKVNEYLFNIIWHNLGKVRAMYRTMLGVEFPVNSDAVFRAVLTRHDLVHRNGRMKSGAYHRFTESDVLAVVSSVENFVGEIEGSLSLKS